MLKSSVEYRKWWLYNRPATIPKNPNRAYAAVWKGWGDWLGTYNPFPCTRRKFRNYRDARAWAQSLGLKNKTQWIDYCRNKNFPADVPKRPDIYYQKSKDWIMWKDFLGYTAADRVAVLNETDHIIYVIQYPDLPTNVFTIGVTNEGAAGLVARKQEHGFTIIAAFFHDRQSDWMERIERYVKQYHIGNKNYIVPNVSDVIAELSLHYKAVR